MKREFRVLNMFFCLLKFSSSTRNQFVDVIRIHWKLLNFFFGCWEAIWFLDHMLSTTVLGGFQHPLNSNPVISVWCSNAFPANSVVFIPLDHEINFWITLDPTRLNNQTKKITVWPNSGGNDHYTIINKKNYLMLMNCQIKFCLNAPEKKILVSAQIISL
jgi:hypothetical protein